MPYIKKMIYSGNVLEIERYPVTRKNSKTPKEGKYNVTSEAQKKLDEKNAVKKFIRLVECNYTKDDLFVTLSYRGAPPDEKQFKKDIQNFRRKLKYHAKKQRLAEPVMMSRSHYEKARPHHHLFLNAYSWDMIKSLWKDKGVVHISNLEPDPEYGFTQVAKYFMAEKNSNIFSKRWCASQNLKKPVVRTQPIKRINIYKQPEAPKGYRIVNVETTDNVFTGVHQYIRCIKIPEKKKGRKYNERKAY